MRGESEIAARFGENLRRARRRSDLSQEALGCAAGVHRTEIGLLENGRRVARVDTLVKLACSLAIPVDELLDGINWVPGKPTARGSFRVSPAGLFPGSAARQHESAR